MVSFDSLGTDSYPPSIVTMAIYLEACWRYSASKNDLTLTSGFRVVLGR